MSATIGNSKTEATIGTAESTLDKVNTAIVQVSVGFMVMISGLIGVWALATLISAAARAGGLLEMGRSWWTAVTGM